jgi:Alpha-galactosidase
MKRVSIPTPMNLFLLVCLLLTTLPSAFAQSDLSGYWDFRVPNDDGTFRETYFEVQQKGETLTGRLFGRTPQGPPLEGTIKNGAIHFATVPPAGAPANSFGGRPIVYDGSYRDGKLLLETHGFRGQLVKGEAIRTTREAAIPAPLPLPVLRDLPDNGLVPTPPMGWNSWNKFAGKITADNVRGMADAIVASGMNKLGYVYINIDDTWEGGRDANGNIITNRKFPDMKALADYVHSKGLKIGIYSSPGPKTCAGYEGSFGHEVQDAKTFAAWGIDYLKYDLCSAGTIYSSTEENHRALYQKMGAALESSGRPIVFSLCQYGENDPWKWGSKVGGNLWRTTGDIRDSWESMDKIGFSQLPIASYNRPGHWNDPDMLEIGNGGMNVDEYRTHMSLWSLLSAPLIAGNDVRNMSDETKSILMNAEVIAIDQDPAAKPVQALSSEGKIESFWRPMADGSIIVGIFNRGSDQATTGFKWSALSGKLTGKKWSARDLWKHETVPITSDTYTTTITAHGIVLLKVSTTH